jgi:hypothetical protein
VFAVPRSIEISLDNRPRKPVSILRPLGVARADFPCRPKSRCSSEAAAF